MKLSIIVLIFISLIFTGCSNTNENFKLPTIKLLPIVVKKHKNINNYKFAIVPNTKNVTSSVSSLSASGYNNSYGADGSSVSKSISPSVIIEGVLLKKDIITIEKSKGNTIGKTLLIKYGQSGRRELGLGAYTLEVTIKMIDEQTLEPIYSCTAEGLGKTEADDIRIAINRCLSTL